MSDVFLQIIVCATSVYNSCPSFLFCLFETQMVKHNAYQEDPYAKEFGIKISDCLASVDARILPAPRVGRPTYCELYSLFRRRTLGHLPAVQLR